MRVTERVLGGIASAERALCCIFAWTPLFVVAAGCGEASRSTAASSGGDGGGAGLGAGGGLDTGTGGMSAGGMANVGGNCGEGKPIPITQAEREALYEKSCSAQVHEMPQLLELVVDVSESMNEEAPEHPGRTKWEVTRDVLLELVVRAEGPGLQEYVWLGLQLFPNQPTTTCINPAARVPIARLGPAGSAQRQLIEEALRSAEPRGGTPLSEAYRLAASDLSQAKTPGVRQLVVVTDGSATAAGECIGPTDELSPIGPEPMLEEVERAAVAGEKTVILATPGSEANRQWLSRAALIGGTAPPGCSEAAGNCHYDLSMPLAWGTELTNWRGAVDFSGGGCDDIAGPMSPFPEARRSDVLAVLMTRSGQTTRLPRVCAETACGEGFQVLPDSASVRLCSDTCSSYWPNWPQLDTVLEVLYTCPDPFP